MAITSTIKIDEESIKEAILAYVSDQGYNLEGNDVDIVITAGRGATGAYATLAIEPKTIDPQEPVSIPPGLTVEDTVDLLEEVDSAEEISIEEIDQAIADSAEDNALDAEEVDPSTPLFGKG